MPDCPAASPYGSIWHDVLGITAESVLLARILAPHRPGATAATEHMRATTLRQPSNPMSSIEQDELKGLYMNTKRREIAPQRRP